MHVNVHPSHKAHQILNIKYYHVIRLQEIVRHLLFDHVRPNPKMLMFVSILIFVPCLQIIILHSEILMSASESSKFLEITHRPLCLVCLLGNSVENPFAF